MSDVETIGQEVKRSVEIPTKPGMYWASTNINGQYDSVLAVYGEAPFLKTRLVDLPIYIREGTPLHMDFGRVKVVGPEVVIPVLGDK